MTELDTYFEWLNEAETALAQVPILLKQFRQKVLSMAVSGELTRDWRMGNTEEEWKEGTLNDYIISITAGKSFKCIEQPPNQNEVGVLKVSAVTWGEFDEMESKTCMEESRVNIKYLVRVGDFLFSRANTIELVGSAVIVKEVNLNLMLSDKTLRFTFNEKTNKYFILYFLRSKNGRDEIERLATGNQVSMRNIGQENIKQIRIPIISLNEQTEIVKRIEELFSIADEIEADYQKAQVQLRLFPQMLLQKAFRGELTPHYASDESAEILLKKIKEEKEKAVVNKKSQKTTVQIQQTMEKTTKRTLIETIEQELGAGNAFTFTDLKAHTPLSYEDLKAQLFTMLDGVKSINKNTLFEGTESPLHLKFDASKGALYFELYKAKAKAE